MFFSGNFFPNLRKIVHLRTWDWKHWHIFLILRLKVKRIYFTPFWNDASVIFAVSLGLDLASVWLLKSWDTAELGDFHSGWGSLMWILIERQWRGSETDLAKLSGFHIISLLYWSWIHKTFPRETKHGHLAMGSGQWRNQTEEIYSGEQNLFMVAQQSFLPHAGWVYPGVFTLYIFFLTLSAQWSLQVNTHSYLIGFFDTHVHTRHLKGK